MEAFLFLITITPVISRVCWDPAILDYLLTIKTLDFSVSSLQVHWAAISTFHPIKDHAIFTHPTTTRFLNGLLRSFPLGEQPTPPWDLNLALSLLIKRPFKPLAICSMFDLSMNVAFLVAIKSARRLNELGVFTADQPFTIFHKENVFLCFHPKFTPKVIWEFHMNQTVHLLVFFPKLHIPDERGDFTPQMSSGHRPFIY